MKKKISSKRVALLYLLCGICWLVVAIMSFCEKDWSDGVMNLGLTLLWGSLSLTYWKKAKEEE